MRSREEIFTDLIEEALDTYKKKDSDYGSSYSDLFEDFGMLAGLIPILNKTKRLTTLVKNVEEAKGTMSGPKVDESIEDTLLDLANYALLFLTERAYEEEVEDEEARAHEEFKLRF